MGMKMRQLKFWGRLCGESLAAAAVISVFWFLIGTGGNLYWKTSEYGLLEQFSLYPYYLLLAGGMVIFTMGITYFQVYLPVVLSMSAARKSAAIGMTECILGIAVGILGACTVIWRLVPGDISCDGWKLMPMYTGVLLDAAAISLFLGGITAKYGKNGWIMGAVCFVVIGVVAGLTVALIGNEGLRGFFLTLLNKDYFLLVAAGIALYLAACIFVVRIVRNIEVRG